MSAWPASGGIGESRASAAAGAFGGRANPNGVPRTRGQFAAAETVATVRYQRQAVVEASGALTACQIRARFALNGCLRIVIAACVSAGRVVRCDGQRIASERPIAAVVARARVSIKVAILPATAAILAGNSQKIRVFGVVARAEAIRVQSVDLAVGVVVQAIAAAIRLALTFGGDALGRAAAAAFARCSATRARAAAARRIVADLDAIRARHASRCGREQPDHDARDGATSKGHSRPLDGAPNRGRLARTSRPAPWLPGCDPIAAAPQSRSLLVLVSARRSETGFGVAG